MKYDKDDFLEMIKDWQADHAPEMDDLEIEEIEIDEDTNAWIAYAKDGKNSYCLTDDGTGNIIINYLGSKSWGGKREGAGRPATGRKRQSFYVTTEEDKALREYLEKIRNE